MYYTSTHCSGGSRSLLLTSDQTDSHVGIDMDSVRRQQQLQVIEQQVQDICTLLEMMVGLRDTVQEPPTHSVCWQICS